MVVVVVGLAILCPPSWGVLLPMNALKDFHRLAVVVVVVAKVVVEEDVHVEGIKLVVDRRAWLAASAEARSIFANAVVIVVITGYYGDVIHWLVGQMLSLEINI